MAIVSSLLSFNREQQKEYLIPIVIKDTGTPSMSGTSTLTVIIGDINDNKMQPGSKDIFVYNYAVRYLYHFSPFNPFRSNDDRRYLFKIHSLKISLKQSALRIIVILTVDRNSVFKIFLVLQVYDEINSNSKDKSDFFR